MFQGVFMEINKSTNPSDIIETTQRLRLDIVNKLTEGGERVPTEGKEVNTLAMMLRDLDAAALTTRKLDIDVQGIDAASKASANVANILKEMGGNPFLIGNLEASTKIPVVDAAMIPDIVLVPGQMKIGSDVLEYAEFVVDDASK
jgi:hypothetical protein